MTNVINNMTDAQRDALAQTALNNAEKAKKRAKDYRERKKQKGMVQVSVWVPEAKSKSLKQAFEMHVKKVVAEGKQPE